VYDPAWAQALQQVFLDDVPACDRVTLDAWRRRGLAERLGEFAASFLEEQS
jgi:hypothetical protein